MEIPKPLGTKSYFDQTTLLFTQPAHVDMMTGARRVQRSADDGEDGADVFTAGAAQHPDDAHLPTHGSMGREPISLPQARLQAALPQVHQPFLRVSECVLCGTKCCKY